VQEIIVGPPAMIESAVEANNAFVARLKAIRDAAQGIN
jgi:hypothetical protein